MTINDLDGADGSPSEKASWVAFEIWTLLLNIRPPAPPPPDYGKKLAANSGCMSSGG